MEVGDVVAEDDKRAEVAQTCHHSPIIAERLQWRDDVEICRWNNVGACIALFGVSTPCVGDDSTVTLHNFFILW